MGFDVRHRRTRRVRESLQSADLIDHVGGEILGGDVDVAAPESGEVAIPHLRADSDALVGGGTARPCEPRGITGVETTGDVGAGDQSQHLLVVTQPPYPETLTEVGVQVDAGPLR